MKDAPPEISVILATPYDFDTLRPALRYLRTQTIHEQLEVILVGSTTEEFRIDEAALAGFHSFRVVHVGPIKSLNIPRAAGIRAATAPVICLTEDHCFPDPTWAEALLRAHRGPWAAVGPAVGLANPQRHIAWANHLIQYCPWMHTTPSGRQLDVPGHNSSYKRELLMSYDRDLESIFIAEARLHADLRRRGYELYLESEARTYHVYITRWRPYLRENYYIGRQFAANRSAAWPRWRRWLYVVGSPLVPLVRTWRIFRRMIERGWFGDLIPGILPALWSGLAASAAGELVGYAFGMGNAAQPTLDLDFRRYRFVSTEESAAIWRDTLVTFDPDPPRPGTKKPA